MIYELRFMIGFRGMGRLLECDPVKAIQGGSSFCGHWGRGVILQRRPESIRVNPGYTT
jgi:hypothetical protein